MNLEINILRDRNALSILMSEDFVRRWKELSKMTSKVTVFQEPTFVQNWYQQYKSVYEPILVVGYDENSKIVGLIPLAFSSKKNSLHHAGGSQAEYHGWLCEHSIQEEFLVQSLVNIKDNFQMNIWQWSWIPPKSDVNWLFSNKLKAAGIYVKTYTQEAPVLDLTNTDLLNRLKKSRSLKTKLNRFKRRENFHIERITSKERAIAIFDTLEKQCDFRQMAANASMPFTNDPIKKKFHIEKLNTPDNIHFTVLWADDSPIAYNFGERDSQTVYLGVMSYDPLDGKNSPGIIFIMKLAELLIEEGYNYFDLTPGGDKYKQKFCNSTQKVYLPTFYFNKKDKSISNIKDSLKKVSKKTLDTIGLSADSLVVTKVGNFVKSLKTVLKTQPSKLIKGIITSIYQTDKVFVYQIDVNTIHEDSLVAAPEIAVNNYFDLLLYNNSNKVQSKKALISNALKRFERENVVYTNVKDNTLLHYSWLIKKPGKQQLTNVNMEFTTPENSYFIDDFFTESNYKDQNLFKQSVSKILNESKSNDISKLFIKISPGDSNSIALIKSFGFTIFHTFIKKRILWMVRKNKM